MCPTGNSLSDEEDGAACTLSELLSALTGLRNLTEVSGKDSRPVSAWVECGRMLHAVCKLP